MTRPLIFVVLDASAKDLGVTMSEKAVLQALVKCINAKRNGTAVWPGNPTIAAEIGAHLETVVKAKRSLHEKGLIKISRDRGKSDVCTVNEPFIRALADPLEKPGGSAPAETTDPPEKAGGYPPEKPGDTPPKNREGTAKGTAKLNSTPDNSSFGCSADLKVGDGDHQRKLAMLGVVAQTTDRMRINAGEQPTEEKKPEGMPPELRRIAAGARGPKERPG